jgi:hypothetical protein
MALSVALLPCSVVYLRAIYLRGLYLRGLLIPFPARGMLWHCFVFGLVVLSPRARLSG